MTRERYDGCRVDPATKTREVRRILDRYLVEVVEAYKLCPWARPAREAAEVGFGVVWGTPSIEAWVGAASELLARPGTRVAMVVAPELAIDRRAFGGLRDDVAARLPHAGIAEFHPDAALDLGSPARLVPFLRRAPDPLLQLVPLAILQKARGTPSVVDRSGQARILGGSLVQATRSDAADQIALANLATMSAHGVAIEGALDDIARDRRDSYARAGIGYR
jgi:hypothetical protein